MESVWLVGSPAFVLFARLLLASVFLMAGTGKALDWKGSILAVERYRILPAALAKAYGACLPLVDIAIAALLYLGITVYGAGLASLTLLSFVIAAGIVIRRGTHLDCGCFGLLYRERIGRVTVARDVVLLLLAVDMLLLDNGRFALTAIMKGIQEPVNALVLFLVLLSFIATLGIIAFGYRRRIRPLVISQEAQLIQR